MRSATLRAAALAASAVLGAAVLGGCSGSPTGPTSSAGPTTSGTASPSPGAISASASPANASPESGTPSSSAKAVQNDLEDREQQRVLSSGDYRLTVSYSTPVRSWTTSGDKSIDVTLTARGVGTAGDPKIFIQRTTVNLALFDASGSLDAPESLSDVATTAPGYLVNFPSEYGASFTVPSLNVGATELRMTFSYTIITQLSRPKPKEGDPVDSSRDYTKQVATDVVVVPLTS